VFWNFANLAVILCIRRIEVAVLRTNRGWLISCQSLLGVVNTTEYSDFIAIENVEIIRGSWASPLASAVRFSTAVLFRIEANEILATVGALRGQLHKV
jgi:hypothetical protein